jgi:hypothetical protein
MSKVDDVVEEAAAYLIKQFDGIPFALVVHDAEDKAVSTVSNTDADGVRRLMLDALLKVDGPPHKSLVSTDQGNVVINPDEAKDNN